MIRHAVIPLSTDADGAATAYSPAFVGILHELIYVPGTLDTGAGLTITEEASGAAILTISSAGTSILRKAPRVPTVDASNSASLYAATGEPVEDRMAVFSRVKVVVASGGTSVAGKLIVIWEE